MEKDSGALPRLFVSWLKRRLPRLTSWENRGADCVRAFWARNAPSSRVINGATLGLSLVTAGFVIDMFLHVALLPSPTWARALQTSEMISLALFCGLGLAMAVGLMAKLSLRVRFGLIASATILRQMAPFSLDGRVLAWALVAFILLGGGTVVVCGERWNQASRFQKAFATLSLLFGLGSLVFLAAWLMDEGYNEIEHRNAAAESNYVANWLTVPDPSLHGSFGVLTLTYGSGKDRRRPEFGREVDLLTETVDGRRMLSPWTDESGRMRKAFWGFDRDELPLQGRVWYPDGAGPFPLILTVHGNHSMEEYSDPGYGYLGELFASRGYIFVSVDQNFINGAIREENDARGWLLLEHLRVWRSWNEDVASGFSGFVDLGRIGLIGHSRGGEAVAVAAAFNKLSHYPDDATIEFDYGFNINAVIAIAPVMGQYRPGGRFTTLLDVNYFVIHGANDGDVSSFSGARQWEQVIFSGEQYRFKSAVYVMGANHGQFNTVWGDMDAGKPRGRLLNRRPLLLAEEQRQIGKVYISAFVEATLRGEVGYLPLLTDARVGADWLPETTYLVEFDDSASIKLATFDEDVDVTTTTMPGGKTRGEGLTVWKEQRIEMKRTNKETAGVYLGWYSEGQNGESADSLSKAKEPQARPARYVIQIPEDFILEPAGSLFLSLADADESPKPPDDNGEDSTGVDEDKPREPLDFTLRVTDSVGQAAELPLSRFSSLQPQLDVQLRKALFDEPKRESEPVFQTFTFPFNWFTAENSALDPVRIRTLELVFDRSDKGVVILNTVGFRRDPLGSAEQ